MSDKNNFDEILRSVPKSTPKKRSRPADPWEDLEVPEREPIARLSIDIPSALMDKLDRKALDQRRTKTELVKILLEWALNED